MAGRKRKQGVKRSANGRVSSSMYYNRDKEANEVVRNQRRKHYGAVSAEDKRNGKGRSHANDRRYGYALGRLQIAGVIDAKQHDAGQDLAELFMSYRRVSDVPPPVLQAIDYVGATKGRGRDLEPDEAASIVRRYTSASRAIAEAGMGAMSAVYDVVFRDIDPADPAKVREGLAALVRHFGRRRRGKKHKAPSATNKVVVCE